MGIFYRMKRSSSEEREQVPYDATPKISGEEKKPRSRLTEIHPLQWDVLAFAQKSKGFQMSHRFIDELSHCEMERLKKMSVLAQRYSEEVMKAMHTVETMLGDMWALPRLQEDFIRTYAALGSEHRTLLVNGPKIVVTNINALDHHLEQLRRILWAEHDAREAHNRLHRKKPHLKVIREGNVTTFVKMEPAQKDEEEEEEEDISEEEKPKKKQKKKNK